MTEFSEVMKQWCRMCNSVPGKSESINLCSDNKSGYVCPLRDKGLCNKPISSQTGEDRIIGEKIILSWAAEHPEPVYPTFGEWLEKQGIVKLVNSDRYEEDGQKVYLLLQSVKNQIPADIAEKLGLKPKEG